MNVYNPLGQTRSDYIRIPVSSPGWIVTDLQTGEVIPNQEIPLREEVLFLPGRESIATTEVLFRAPSLPALGSKFFAFQKSTGDSRGHCF